MAWSGCSAGSRPGTTGAAWSPSARRSRSRRGRPASRRSPGEFVAMTETALSDLLAKDLTDLDLVALMIDGVYFAEHLCVVALGIDIDRTKHPLGLVEGSTENTTVVKTLLTGLRDRGLDTTKPIMAVLDGAKALAAGVQEVFDKPVIGRCHARNVKRWRDGQMALRWCASGMVEASKQFRRVNGHLHLPKLRAALDAEIAGTLTPAVQDEEVVAA